MAAFYVYGKIKKRKLQKAMQDFVPSDYDLAVEIDFVSQEVIREVNRTQRNVDSVTDVLSFPMLDGIKGRQLRACPDLECSLDEKNRLLLGSILICKDRAKEQAKEYGHSYKRELYYLAVHGIMHLLGYDHMTDEDKAEMREKEEAVLQKMKISRD